MVLKTGDEIEVRELPMFRRDTHDYEPGSPEWQAVMAHNCAVNLLSNEPLSEGEMAFIRLQNQHLNFLKKKGEKKRRGKK